MCGQALRLFQHLLLTCHVTYIASFGRPIIVASFTSQLTFQLFQGRKRGSDSLFDQREVPFYYHPDPVEFYPLILMDEHIAQGSHTPG